MDKWRKAVGWLSSNRDRSAAVLLGSAAVVLGSAVVCYLVSRSLPPSPPVHVVLQPPGNVRGLATARLTVTEYASLNCPNCARFDEQLFPRLLTVYINTGKVRFIFQNVATDETTREAAALSRCARQDDYFAFVDLLMRLQSRWVDAPNPRASLIRIASGTGLSPDRARNCLSDPDVLRFVDVSTWQARDAHVEANLPVFLVNGRLYSGVLQWSDLTKLLDAKLDDRAK